MHWKVYVVIISSPWRLNFNSVLFAIHVLKYNSEIILVHFFRYSHNALIFNSTNTTNSWLTSQMYINRLKWLFIETVFFMHGWNISLTNALTVSKEREQKWIKSIDQMNLNVKKRHHLHRVTSGFDSSRSRLSAALGESLVSGNGNHGRGDPCLEQVGDLWDL